MARVPGVGMAGVLAVLFCFALVVIAGTGSEDTRFGDARQLDARRPEPVGAGVHAGSGAAGSVVPPEVVASQNAWPLPNRDYANTRATTASNIDAATVSRLGVAWVLPLGGASKWGSAASG